MKKTHWPHGWYREARENGRWTWERLPRTFYNNDRKMHGKPMKRWKG